MAQSLTLNEIRARALAFSLEWKGEKSEAAEKQTFWNEFFWPGSNPMEIG